MERLTLEWPFWLEGCPAFESVSIQLPAYGLDINLKVRGMLKRLPKRLGASAIRATGQVGVRRHGIGKQPKGR